MTGPILRKYTYQLKTCSTLVLSPRDHQGFYSAADDFTLGDLVASELGESKINIIYPFYQYGTYCRYEPDRAQYYIPGSSIKGALLAVSDSETEQQKWLVDDIKVERGDIQLYHLYKVQNKKKEAAQISEFFPNVAVEMLNADVEYSGELFCDGDIDRCFRQAQQMTKSKLDQLIHKINRIYDQVKGEEDRRVLQEMKQNLTDNLNLMRTEGANNHTFTILLGGYKGLVLSAKWKTEDYNSAIFLDMKKKLPHGLVQITLE